MKRTGAWLLLGAGAASILVSPIVASRASRLDREGRKAERDGQTSQAFLYYSQAMAADPRKALYREHAQALAPALALQAAGAAPAFFLPSTQEATEPQQAAVPHEIDLSPEAVFDSITARELAEARELLPAARLQAAPGLQNYDLNGDRKSLFEQVAGRLGLRAVFDSDYQPGRPMRFQLNGVSGREALHALEAVTNSFAAPIGPKTIIVAEETELKRKELEQVETLSIPMPSVLAAQEITELGQAVKQAAGIDKIYWDAQANQIVVRDRVSRVLAAESILHDLIAYRSQVAIDLEFIELSEAEMQQVGVDLQTSFPLDFIGQLTSGKLSTVLTLAQLSKFSFTKMFGVGLVNADVIAEMTRAGARNLLRTSIVSVDNQKATFHAGSKYPIISSQFVGGVSTGGRVYQPTPTFTFEDLGIVVTVTPHVHGDGEITLELETDYKILGATSVNGLPIVSGRKMQSTIRLRADQWAVVAGLTSESKSRAVSGPAFFSNIPLLGHIISHFTGRKANTYVIVSMKPHLMSLPAGDRVTHAVYVGSETRSITPL